MSWQSRLDPQTKEVLRQQAELALGRRSLATNADPMVADRLEVINQRAPWLKPEQQLALAKSNASDAAIDRAGEFQGREIAQPTTVERGIGRVAQYGISSLAFLKNVAGKALDVVPGALEAVTTAGDLFYDYAIDPMKPVTRYGVATLDAIPETIQNVSSLFVATKAKRRDLGGFWDSLSIATLLDDPEAQGEGFIISDELRAEQARRARDFRGELNGSAFTVGRGAASVFFTPNSEGYRTASGVIDAIVNVIAPDPTKLVSKTIGAVARGAGEVPLLAKTDVTALRAALKTEAGITDNIMNGSIDLAKWNRFMDEKPTARALVDEVVNSDDELYIMEEIFNYDISPDMATSLAGAKTRDEVKAILSEGWVVGDGTLSSNIYDYRTPIKSTIERAPLINSIRKSRLMRAVPEQYVVINGDRFERTKAVRNMINSARAAGATEDEIRVLSKKIIPSFRAGSTADDQYDAYGAYEETLKVILRKNGVEEPIIETVLAKPRGEMDKLRAYMIDRAGNETDHGTLNAFIEMIKDDLPTEIYTDFLDKAGSLGDEIGFARPMQIVELLNRVQTLPDPRELRRLTRNSFFAEMLKTEAGGPAFKKGGPLGLLTTSKRAKILVDDITDPKEYKRLGDEIEKIKQSAGPNLTKDQVDEIDELQALRDDLIADKQIEKKVLTGERKFVYELIETIQNVIWKPLNLATIGYVVRNSIDAQIRMNFGAGVGLAHPVDYINMLAFGRRGRSILGEDISGLSIESLRKDHQEFLSNSLRKQGFDTTYTADHMRRTGMWTAVSRQNNFKGHTDAIIQQGRLAYSDPLQGVVARGLALGEDPDDIIEMALRVAKQKDNYDEIKGIFKRGATYSDRSGARIQAPPVDFDTLDPKRVDEYLRMHIRSVVFGNVNNNTGNIPAMQIMYGFNRVPMMDQVAVAKRLELSPIAGAKGVEPGSVVKTKDGQEALVLRLDGEDATIVPVHAEEAFKGMAGSQQARKLVRKQPLYNPQTGSGLPEKAAKEIHIRDRQSQGWFAATQEASERMVEKLFGELYNDKYVKTLERSPVFRKFYYDEISKNLGRLDSGSASELIKRLRTAAKAEGQSIGKYIGDEKVAARIEEIAKSGTKGRSTAEELDDYARFVALNKSKDLLYDASERNNLEDIVRIIAPFAGAWRDIVGTYMGFSATENVRALRSFQRVYTGAKYADPDGDGRGMFYEDPQTGKLMFAFPFSGAVSNLVQRAIPGGGSPVRSILEAPVKQLSQGINVFPALGPMAQVAASELLPDVPKYNQITEVLLPYGKKGIGTTFNVTPGWIQKAWQVLQADTRNTTNAYFNTFSETYRAKSASGQYDLSREDEKQRLYDDARWDARWLTALRAFSQFLGPTAGTTEFVLETNQGDVFAAELSKELRAMQEEDYDTAVPRFLELYGENMALYVASKSRSLADGLETSEEFGAWTQMNEDLIKEFPDVAAYFAPKGSDFNFTVWRRQLDEGLRENLTVEEMLKMAQERIGAAKYRQARRMFGAYPSGRQREVLAAYREQLHQKYPGFPRFAEFLANKYENSVANLEQLLDNPRVQDSGVTPSLRAYLNKRRALLNQYGAKSFRAKKMSGPRAYLYQYGDQLSRENPEFDRIWGRLLAQEVDE